MLIEQNGDIDYKINTVLLTNDRLIGLDEDQFFQITDTGKRLELWQGKEQYFKDNIGAGMRRLAFWPRKSLISFYVAE